MSRRKGIMLCYPFEEKRLLKWNPPYLVQPKLEGDRSRALSIQNQAEVAEPVLVSSEENVINSVPHINKAILDQGLLGVPLDGELYNHDMTHSEIREITGRSVNLHQDYEKMEYHIFDLVRPDLPQYERTSLLNKIPIAHPLKHVPTSYASNLEEVMEINDWYVDKGYEGIIVRHIDAPYIQRRSTFVMKFKPKKSDYYLIYDITEAFTKDTKQPKGMAGSIECIDDMGTTFGTSPGIGWTEERKIELWNNRQNAIGKWCEVHYQNITSGRGVPYFGRFVEIVDVNPEKIDPINLQP